MIQEDIKFVFKIEVDYFHYCVILSNNLQTYKYVTCKIRQKITGLHVREQKSLLLLQNNLSMQLQNVKLKLNNINHSSEFLNSNYELTLIHMHCALFRIC